MINLYERYLNLTRILLATAIIGNIHAAENGELAQAVDAENIENPSSNPVPVSIPQAMPFLHVMPINEVPYPPFAASGPIIALPEPIIEADGMMRLARSLANNSGPDIAPQMSRFMDTFPQLGEDEQREALRLFNADTNTMDSDILALQIIASSFGNVGEARRFLQERKFSEEVTGSN